MAAMLADLWDVQKVEPTAAKSAVYLAVRLADSSVAEMAVPWVACWAVHLAEWLVAYLAGLLADAWADPWADPWAVSTAGLLAVLLADEMAVRSVDMKVVCWADR